jgi:arsenite-transporting ATPase
VRNQHLVVNGLLAAAVTSDPIARAMERHGRDSLARLPVGLQGLPFTTVPLAAHGLLGADVLRTLTRAPLTAITNPAVPADAIPADLPSLAGLLEEIARPGRGVILTMGKGGVGKTTIAAALAVALAERGFSVQLSTTDPAAHLTATINGALPNLTVSRIDPVHETALYAADVMATAGASLDEQGRALLAEDLRSPCTEEISVFRAFAQAVARGRDGFVVLDTAPTGHTILLLDAALAYHREVARQATAMPDSVRELLPRLRDPDFTRVLIVTLPEATPVHEAAQLQRDLVRAEIQPFAWVINQSLTPLRVTDPVLRARRKQEMAYIREVTERLATRVALIPWQADLPVGVGPLRALLGHRNELATAQV